MKPALPLKGYRIKDGKLVKIDKRCLPLRIAASKKKRIVSPKRTQR